MKRFLFTGLIFLTVTGFASQSHSQTLPDTSLAKQYFAKAEGLAKAAQYDSAIVYFEKAGIIYEKNELWESFVRCLNKLGDSAWRKGELDKGMELLEQAKEIGLQQLGEQHTEVASSYHNIGIVHFKKGNYNQALEFMRSGLNLRLAILGNQHTDVAKSYHNIGIVYHVTSDYRKALEFYQKALDIILAVLDEQDPEAAKSYNNMGGIYWIKGDYDRTLKFLQKALNIQLATLGEKHPQTAAGYNNIGTVYHLLGDYEQALKFYQKDMSIISSALGEQHSDMARSYLNIGENYEKTGNYDQALEFLQKSLNIRLSTLGSQHPKIARAYNAIGSVYAAKNNYNRALEFYQKALKIQLATMSEHNSYVAITYGLIADAYHQKGDYGQAGVFNQKALNIRLSVFGAEHADVAESNNSLGNIYYEQGKHERALSYYQKALRANAPGFEETDPYLNPSLDNIFSEERLLVTLQSKARTLARRHVNSEDLSDLQAAFSTFQLLDQLIDRMRSGYKAEGSKLFLAEKATSVYENAIETALDLAGITNDPKYKAHAFAFAEKAKAAVLWETLLDSRARQFAGIPDSLLEKERDLRIDLAFYDTRIQKETLKKEKRDSVLIAQFEDRYFDLDRRYEQLTEQFEKDYPQYYALKYQTQGVAIHEFQKQLDEQTTVLEYFTGDSAIYIFTISRTHFDVTKLPRGSLLESQIEQLRLGITKNHGEGDYRLYTENAHQLYQALFEPVEGRIKTDKLIIIPGGALNNLAFETLLSADVAAQKTIDYAALPYLGKKYITSYSYSARLYAETTEQTQEQPPLDYLAFAPVFSNGLTSDSRGVDLIEKNRNLDSAPSADKIHLPASKEEVLAIQELFQKNYGFVAKLSDWLIEEKTRVYLEEYASEANLKKEQLGNYRYLHLATHGFANKNTPDLSGLLLARDSASVEDGVLHLPEIYNLELNADLVVLSACESGAGKLAKGEGLIGLTRGFLYAGAKNLLVSLWQVNDWSTSDLMLSYYTKMLAGKSKAEALYDAKLQLIESNPDYAKPYHWAPFILIGR